MKKAICLFLTVVCLLSLASCYKGDAPYTPIPENTEDYEMGGAIHCGVILPLSFEEYAKRSELAIECEYIGPYEYMLLETKDKQIDADDAQITFTYQKFKVTSVLRGEFSDSEIIVRTSGGTVYTKDKKRITDEYEWTPDFKEGQKWILFLNKGSRLDRFCIDSEYYTTVGEIIRFDEKLNKYCTLTNTDALQLTAKAKGESADKYCFTANELKTLLDDIAAPPPPTDEKQRIDYNAELGDGEESKIYDYARIVVRHKAN